VNRKGFTRVISAWCFSRNTIGRHWQIGPKPRVRFPGTRIEHHTFFLQDPSENLLEFKHYTHESAIFGEREFRAVGDTSPAG
jgi:extradiol dioxygenase family protein